MIAGQVDALRMNVIMTPRLFNGAKDVFFDSGPIFFPVPAVGREAVVAQSQGAWSAQTDADVIAPAQLRRQTKDLLLAAAATMQKDQQRIRIIRLVAGRQEGPQRPSAAAFVRGRHFRGVKTLGWTRQTGGQFGMCHEKPDCSSSSDSAKGACCKVLNTNIFGRFLALRSR